MPERCRHRPAFRWGLASLEAGHEGGNRVALMCAEQQPQRCHRTTLIAEELVALRVPVSHIDEHGHIRSHAEIMELITGGQERLFGDRVA